MLSKLSNAQIIFGAAVSVVSLHSVLVFYRETRYKAALDRIMAGRKLDPMDERRQLDYSHLERAVFDFFDLRKIGLMRNKDVDVIPRPKDAKIAPIDWHNTKTEYKNL